MATAESERDQGGGAAELLGVFGGTIGARRLPAACGKIGVGLLASAEASLLSHRAARCAARAANPRIPATAGGTD